MESDRLKVNSEERGMALRRMGGVLLCLSLFAISIFAQKNEHYNSPLYSPKTYDPSVDVSTGLPDALKKIGIEQKLGAQLPLDAEFKDEDGKAVKLGSYFNTGRPV
ncbi:MAG: hypothetical protein ABIO36_08120, partial [Pyrinomonadaceae bacterium]